jgi:hypothetical protein
MGTPCRCELLMPRLCYKSQATYLPLPDSFTSVLCHEVTDVVPIVTISSSIRMPFSARQDSLDQVYALTIGDF